MSVAALAWLTRQFNVPELSDALLHADLGLLVPIPLLVLLSFALRAQRWRLLVQHTPPIKYWPSFRALMIGYLLNNVLPARAGDIARALELGRTEQMSRTKVFATLVTEKVADLIIVIAILALVMMAYPALPNWVNDAGLAVALLAGFAISLLILAHTTGRRWIPALIGLFAARLPKGVGNKLGEMVISALDGIAGVFRPARAVGFLLLTALLWAIEVGIVFLVGASFDLPLPLGNALFVLLILAIGTMVPSSPGFVGTFEFFGVAALALVGVHGTPALACVVLLHVVTLLGSTLIGTVCFFLRPKTVLAISRGIN